MYLLTNERADSSQLLLKMLTFTSIISENLAEVL